MCPVVNTPGYELPNVVLKQTKPSYRTIFTLLYEISNRKGYFDLNAKSLSEICGFSRKTIYEALAFLKRVNLVWLIEEKTGRGRHSLYKLNWRKIPVAVNPTDGQDSTTDGINSTGDLRTGQNSNNSAEKPVENSVSVNAKSLKCHPPHPYKVFKEELHPSGDININSSANISLENLTTRETLSPQSASLWRQSMRAFRKILGDSKIPKRSQRLCIGVIGRAIKGKRREEGLVLYHALEKHVKGLATPAWAKSAPQICRWFWSVLNKLWAGSYQAEQPAKPRVRKPKHQFVDWNEWQWNQVSKEKDLVLRRRQRVERTWEDDVAHWLDEQKSESEFIKRRADLARMKLREQHRERNVDHIQTYMS